jgi:hypothetical protein
MSLMKIIHDELRSGVQKRTNRKYSYSWDVYCRVADTLDYRLVNHPSEEVSHLVLLQLGEDHE